jgi:hypothetical protein
MPRNIAYTATQDNGQQTPAFQAGQVVYPATAIVTTDFSQFDVGFKPAYVQFVNLTDRTTVEWYQGMAANTCLKTAAAGTRTLETANGGITVTDNGFQVSQNATLAAILASKTCYFIARA